MKRSLPVYLIMIFVFCQAMKTDFLYAANWQGMVTVNNQTNWTEETKQNYFVSVLNLGVDDQLFIKNRLSLNLFLPYRKESPGGTSYSPSATASVVGENYSLFTNYGVFTSSDQLLGSKESRREQVGLNVFPKKLPSLFFGYNKNEEVKSFSGGKGPSIIDWTLNSNYTFKGITIRGGYREQGNKDATEKLTFKNKGFDWGATTTFQPLPMTSVSVTYDSISNSNEDFLTGQKSDSTSETTSVHISTSPFEWSSISSGYSLTNSEQTIKQLEGESKTSSTNENADITLTLIPYPKFNLRTSLGQKKQKQDSDSKTTDFISYGISYNTPVAKKIDASLSVTRTVNDDSTFGKVTTDVFSLSSNMLLHPKAETRLSMSITKNELPGLEEQEEGQTIQAFSNSWTIGVISYPTDKVNLNINYQTSGSSDSFSIFKPVSHSANINLRYTPKRDVSYNISSISSFGKGGNKTTLTGSMAYRLGSGASISLSYSRKMGETSRDSFGSQLYFPLPKGTTLQINCSIAPLFSGEGSSSKSLGVVITKRL